VVQGDLHVHLLGEVSIQQNGVDLTLSLSRKTRALLAFLLITGKSHRREHLCEMFCDNTADPRGALRWSLSRLRSVLDDAQTMRLVTSHDSVRIDSKTMDVDVSSVRATHDDPHASTAQLRHAATLLSQKPLAGLELPQAEDYQAWLMEECEELQGLRPGILERLVRAEGILDGEALKWLRLWCRLDPFAHDAPLALWQKLIALNRHDDAADVAMRYKDTMGPDAKAWIIPPMQERAQEPKSDQQSDNGCLHRQTIGFCKAADGVKIAYAKVGSGPVLVKTANWLNHLELDWQSPIWGKTFQQLATNHTLVRYDERGNGMSDWDVQDISMDAFLRDLEAVVDSQSLDRFPLLGMSQGCAVSIEYAVRHPERVSALILIGGYVSGWRIGLSAQEREQREAVLTLTRHGWGTPNPAYRQIFSQTFMPDADPEDLTWFNDFQRRTTSPENAVRFQEAFGHIDVRHLLSQVKVPTLVLHARGDQRIPLHQGRELATNIPNARLVTLESRSHIILGDEPAWRVCMDEINQFLQEHT